VTTGNVFLVLPMIEKRKISFSYQVRILTYVIYVPAHTQVYDLLRVHFIIRTKSNRLILMLFVTYLYAFDTPLFNNEKVRKSNFPEVRRRVPEIFPLHTFKITWPFECLSTANIIFGGKVVPRRWKDWCLLIFTNCVD
jgi:hypothetical protein